MFGLHIINSFKVQVVVPDQKNHLCRDTSSDFIHGRTKVGASRLRDFHARCRFNLI